MAMSLGDRLAEAEINPLFVLREGHGVRAADWWCFAPLTSHLRDHLHGGGTQPRCRA
jgi:hypothetical protein